MQYGHMKDVHLPVSRIVFGTYIPNMVNGKDVEPLLDAAFEAGINAFDTAAAYGCSEAMLGRWLAARKNRDRVVIITKGANPDGDRLRMNPAGIQMDLQQSLDRLGTDYIDVYLLHRDDPSTPVGVIAELLNDYHRRGIIGAFGSSNWAFPRVREMNRYCEENGLQPFTVVSPSFSLADCIGDPWGGSVTLSMPEQEEERELLRKNQTTVLCYSALARGFLSGKVKSSDSPEILGKVLGKGALEYGYPINMERLRRAEVLAEERGVPVSTVAISWLFHQKLNLYAILGSSSIAHIRANLSALDFVLSDAEADWLCSEGCVGAAGEDGQREH